MQKFADLPFLWRILAEYSEILHKVREEYAVKSGEPLSNKKTKPAKPVKSRTKVTILGQDYVVKGACSTEQIKGLADYVDKVMQETRNRCPNLPVHKLAVLTSLNLAEELFRVKDDYESLLQTLEEEQKK